MRLLREHHGPLAADLSRYHGLRPLSALREWGLPLSEVAAYAAHLPPDSAVARAQNPDWAITPEALVMREVEHAVRVVAWQQTEDGHRKAPQHYPDRIPLTKAERAVAAIKSSEGPDVMPVEEMAQRLGWTRDGRREA